MSTFHVEHGVRTRAGNLLDVGRRQCVEEGVSPWQRWSVWDTALLGRVYLLDDVLMAAEADQHAAHQALVAPAMTLAASYQRVLIIGGGDGASLATALRNPAVRHVRVVELDPAVVALSERHLDFLHQAAFTDPRAELRIGEGYQALLDEVEQGAQWDHIVYDLTDPGTHASPLYADAGLAACARLLGSGGVLSLHLGCPTRQLARVAVLLQGLRRHFQHIVELPVVLPSHGGNWSLAHARSRAVESKAD